MFYCPIFVMSKKQRSFDTKKAIQQLFTSFTNMFFKWFLDPSIRGEPIGSPFIF